MRWVAFLRAINTGNRRVTGKRLVSIFESIGLLDVSSFQASGNILFTADEPDRDKIEDALQSGLGYPVPTVLRNSHDLDRIAGADPFDEAQLEGTERRVQVMLLRDPMPPETLEKGLPDVTPDDLVEMAPSEVFWLPRAGISGSRLSPAAIEARLGSLTVRTLNTIERIQSRL